MALFRVRLMAVRSLFIACILSPFFAVATETVRVAFLSAEPRQVSALVEAAEVFERQNNQIKVDILTFSDAAFKANIDGWLENGEFDIVHWQAGQRLSRYISADAVAPLNEFIDPEELNQHYADVTLRQLSHKDILYGIPLANYSWGFYYNTSLFLSLGLTVPTTWPEFLAVCQALQAAGITPLVQANAEHWETVGWLDFLALQNGGQRLRNSLINANPMAPRDANAVIEPLNSLVEQHYFFAANHTWTWVQALATVARGMAGMTLTGQFAEKILLEGMEKNLGFFPFPGNPEQGTVVPLDLLMIPKASNHKMPAAKFLQFLSSPQVNSQLALGLGFLPTTTDEVNAVFSERQKIAQAHIQRSPLHVQYFDRDADTAHANRLDSYLDALFATGQTSQLQAYLEGRSYNSLEQFLPNKDDAERIDISTIVGHQGTFMASRIMAAVYAQLGYSINVTRFPSTHAAVNSHSHGMDAELVRIHAFADHTSLVRVEEPLYSDGLFVVLHKQHCDKTRPLNQLAISLGVSSDALAFQHWADNNEIALTQFANNDVLFNAFNARTIDGMLVFETTLRDYPTTLAEACKFEVKRIPFYHYLNPAMAQLKPGLEKQLAEFKQTQAYQSLIRDFLAQ